MATKFTFRKLVETECFCEVEAENAEEALKIAKETQLYGYYWDEGESITTYLELYCDDDDNEYDKELDLCTFDVKGAETNEDDKENTGDGDSVKYWVEITEIGETKDELIKAIWNVVGGPISSIEQFVEDEERHIIERFPKAEAEDMKNAFEAAGATVILTPETDEEYDHGGVYDVILLDPGESKDEVIKVVKDACGISLDEAKELVDSCRPTLKSDLCKADAEKLRTDLEAAGAQVNVFEW